MSLSVRLVQAEPATLLFTFACDSSWHALPPLPLRVETSSVDFAFKTARKNGWSFAKDNDVRCPGCKP